MRRRWIVGLGLFATLASAEAWWFLGAPKGTAFAYPFDFGRTMRVAFVEALSDKEFAGSIGYTEETRAKDKAALKRMNEPYVAVNRAYQKILERDFYKAAQFREEAIRPLLPRSLEQWKSIPTLTEKQEDVLVKLVARRTGIWCLSAPEVAKRVGLTPDQSRAIDEMRMSLLRQMKAEERTSRHDQMVLEGAPARAIVATDEMGRIGDRLFLENRAFETEQELRLTDKLAVQTGRPIPWAGRRFLASHREMLEIRRKAALRKEAEQKILATLSPEQRTRWNALIEGE